MRTFFLVRSEDLSQTSGTGVVAEGAVFDNGLVVLTWLSEVPTITTFRKIQDVERLHGHEGRTKLIIEGRKKTEKEFEKCRDAVRIKKAIQRKEEES